MTRTKGANGYKTQDFIDVIPGTGGIIKYIAARVGCSRTTALRYIRQFATVAAAYAEEVEATTDSAESVIIHDIEVNKDVQTAKWYLTMKAADRGYAPTTKKEVSGPDGAPIQTADLTPDLSGLTITELEEILRIYEKLGTGSEKRTGDAPTD
jgi:hypothetical protein